MTENFDLQALLGQSADEVARELADFSETAKVLSSERHRLLEQHPKQWVGVFDGKVEVYGDTLAAVMLKIEEKGYPARSVNVRYIDSDERVFVL